MSFRGTVYQHDYTTKPIRKTGSYRAIIRNPILDSYAEYLKLDDYKGALKDSEEYVTEYINGNLTVNNPSLAERIKADPLNQQEICRHNCNLSTYKKDYCDLFEKTERNFDIAVKPLPKPTTYQKSYQNPIIISKDAYKPRSTIRHKDTVLEECKLFTPRKTGATDYMKSYGKLGQEIIEHQLYGKMQLLTS